MTDHGVIIPDMSGSFNDDISADDDDIAADEEDTTNDLLESIPAMVSITRVPKSRPPEQDIKPPNIHVKGGPPPPLLRVGGLPPMPRLRLGNMRGTAPPPQRQPIYPPSHPIHSMMNMMGSQQRNGGFSESMAARQQMGHPGLPVIAGTMSLQNSSLRHQQQQQRQAIMQQPRPGMRMGMMPGMRSIMRPSMRPTNQMQAAQMAAARQQQMKQQKTVFRPNMQAAAARPVQVRTVFVPPPMNMGGGSLTPNAVSRVGGPRMINAFPLNGRSSNQAAGITITPLSNGKSNGVSEDMYDDLDLDEEDDGVPEDDDDEYNEITEAPSVHSSSAGSIVPIKNLLPHAPSVSGSVTLHRLLNKKDDPPALPAIAPRPPHDASRRNSIDSVGSSAASIDSTGQPRPATARKSFKPKSNGVPPPPLQSLKRRVDSIESNKSDESIKKQKTGGAEGLVSAAAFGTHFLSSLVGAGAGKGLQPVKMEEEEEEFENKPAESLMLKTLCTCEAESIKVAGKEGLTCQAVEVVGGYRVGCKNKITRSEIVKTSQESDPVSLCDLHRDRLLTHCCCPVCGEFCSHGLVFMCRINKSAPPHLFHRFCYQKAAKEDRCCPHCSSKRSPLAVQLKMTMTRTPLKILNHTSKISTSKLQVGDKPPVERWETDKQRAKVVNYTLPNGNILSADGMPKGLETDKLELMLEELKNKSLVKHTTRNMYQPTAGGENVKLLQLLALDYSPRQRFAEAIGGTPLHVAAVGNHVLTAHILIQAGADINALDDSNETPLMISCSQGFADVTRYLLSAGAQAGLSGDDGMTALHFATQNGHLECAHVILSQNKLPRNFINVKDDGGWTPLVWACEHKHEAVIRYLIEQGADPFVRDVEMNISLHWASFSGSRAITDLLLSAGCNVNQANAIGETPLHIALRQDHYECALLLIARGARLDLPNQQAQLPSSCLTGENPKLEALINLGTTLHKLMKERTQKFLSEKTVVQDISNGKENIPISAVNGEDFEMGPSGYKYVKSPVVTNSIPIDRNVSTLQHCRCKNNCVSEDSCRCSDISTKSWYDQNGILKEGFDYAEPPMIFECNEMCDCNQNSCNNRVVQHGITARIQVYKTYGMGWGAKAMVDIPKGGFVCEYVGELISDAEAEQRENDSYLFDLENREGETFCLDANKYGNVARFINHSCSPNLVPVKVFSSHQDLRFPHIALFASKNIKKGDVLGFDYGEKFWVIKHKFFTCWCGGEKCKYSKNSIGKTLQEYYKKIETCKSPDEEQKQTGKLKLKLRMEEGKVVKVDDSGLLPGESRESRENSNGKKSPKREEKERKSPDLKPKKSSELKPSKSDGKKSPDLKPKKSVEGKKSADLKPKKSSEGKKSPKHESKRSPKHETASILEATIIEGLETDAKEDRKSPIMIIKKSAIIEYKPAKSPSLPPLDNGVIENILEPADPTPPEPLATKKIRKEKVRRASSNSTEKMTFKEVPQKAPVEVATPMETEPEPEPELEPELNLELELGPETEPELELEPEVEPDTIPEPEAKTEPEPVAEPKPVAVPEPVAEAEPMEVDTPAAPQTPAGDKPEPSVEAKTGDESSSPIVRRGRGRPPRQEPKSNKKAATPSKKVAVTESVIAAPTPKIEEKPVAPLDPKELRVLKKLEIDLKTDSRPTTPVVENGGGRPKRTRKSLAD